MGKVWSFSSIGQTLNQGNFWTWVDKLGGTSKAGVSVTNSNALTSTAYYAGVTLIAQTLAQVPLILYKRLERGKERAISEQLYHVLHDEPNPYMSAYTYYETLQGHILTWGNAYAEIEWEPDGQVRHLWPLRPDKMQVKWKDGKIVYIYSLPAGENAEIKYKDILQIPGYGFDGLIGYDPITMVREAIGLAKATEEFGSRFFSNGSQLSGVLTHPQQLKDTSREHMKESWEKMHQGLSNKHRIAILEEGVTFQQIGVPPENAQFLETRKFQVTEIARFLHLPPHMIADMEHATFSNIEHQGIEFVTYTMMPWFTRWAQNVNRKLIPLADKRTMFSEFLPAALLKGDVLSRYQSYAVGRMNGWLSADDIREMENMNPIDGGDVYYMPLNMMPLGESAPAPLTIRSLDEGIETKSKRSGMIRARTAKVYRQIFIDAGEKIVKAETKKVRVAVGKYLSNKKMSSKSKTEWFKWLDNFYKEHHDTIKKTISPAVSNLAEEIQKLALDEVGSKDKQDLAHFLDSYSEAFTTRYIESSTGQLKQLATEADALDAVNNRLDEWEETRPGKVGMNESVKTANAVTKVVFAAVGITKLVWMTTSGDSCPLCDEMDGRVVGIEKTFLESGDELTARGSSDLEVYQSVSHPPLHQGCSCVIVAG